MMIRGLFAALLIAAPTAAADLVEAPVLVSSVQRGDILSAADFQPAEMAENRARGAVLPEEAEGLEARRNLAAGRIVRERDLVEPRLVRRGDQVSILVQSGALTITARGEALEEGAEGDTVRVVTTASRTLDGQVAADGSVIIPLR